MSSKVPAHFDPSASVQPRRFMAAAPRRFAVEGRIRANRCAAERDARLREYEKASPCGEMGEIAEARRPGSTHLIGRAVANGATDEVR